MNETYEKVQDIVRDTVQYALTQFRMYETDERYMREEFTRRMESLVKTDSACIVDTLYDRIYEEMQEQQDGPGINRDEVDRQAIALVEEAMDESQRLRELLISNRISCDTYMHLMGVNAKMCAFTIVDIVEGRR